MLNHFLYRATIILGVFILSHPVFSQAPDSQLKRMEIVDTFAWKAKVELDFPDNTDSVLIFISTENNSSTLSNNTSYAQGQWVSKMKLIKKVRNNTNSIEILGLRANTKYYMLSYTYNSSGMPQYCTKSPLIQSFITKGGDYGNYYKELDTQQNVFLTQLSKKLKNHTFSSYDDFKKVILQVYVQDTFVSDSSAKYVVCDYSGIKAYYETWKQYFSFPQTNFSREHTLPQSWMQFTTDDLTKEFEGVDHHNIALVEADVNSRRSNYPLGKVTSNVKTVGEAKYADLPNQDPNSLFEPKDGYKGNASRSIFYQMLCYNGLHGKTWGFQDELLSFADEQDQEVLKTWAREDKVDNFEIARHECIASIQGNRNPFIDFPDWIDCIDFDIMKQLKTCEGLVVGGGTPSDTSEDSTIVSISNSKPEWDIWFQIVGNDLIVHYYMDEISDVNVGIYDMTGRELFLKPFASNKNENVVKIPIEEYANSTYILRLNFDNISKTFNFSKEY